MEYRSFGDLSQQTRNLAMRLPNDYDLIVGIPRSGLMAANIISLYLHLPMTDVEGLRAGRILQSGQRHVDGIEDISDLSRVLVVDDTVNTGSQMEQTQSELAAESFPFEIDYAAIFISKPGHRYVDYWGEVVPYPRLFEWNIMHHYLLENACVDIDGVLCRDPLPEENDDGEEYLDFIANVEPNFVPSKKIGWLVTSRLERYREHTERWLDAHGIEYEKLVMMDLPDMETRQMLGNHGEYKAKVYNKLPAELFIESSMEQSTEIAETTGKMVYCFETSTMLNAGSGGSPQLSHTVTKAKSKFGEYAQRAKADPQLFVSDAVSFGMTKAKRTYYSAKFYLSDR